jgi:S1-C subfamily serine protease
MGTIVRLILSAMGTFLIFGTAVLPTLTLAQDAVPVEILQRTLYIKVGDVVGTAFKVDYKGRVFLITARHVVSGLAATESTIQVQRTGAWQDFKIRKKLLPSSDAVDIAILQTDETVSQPYKIQWQDRKGVTSGQQVWFLGYPYGLGTHFSDADIPFIKRGTMSAIDASNPDAILFYIDGFNNPGFSGGPIIYWDFSERVIKILGVVQGYRSESAKVVINGVENDTALLVNSGILVGYGIKHAFDAIEKAEAKDKWERKP